MSRFTGPRGLIGYAQFDTAQGEHVELQESSSVSSMTINGEVKGPFVWLRVNRGETGSFAHLSVRDATELRDALSEFLGEGANSEPEWEYGVVGPTGRMVNNGDYTIQQTHRRRKAGAWMPLKQEGEEE